MNAVAAVAREGASVVTAAQAIRDATYDAMEADPRVFVLGEGVADPKAIFETTRGLLERFGPHRVMEMPIAENGWTGLAIGAALLGQRPILVHQRLEFALLSLEQLFDNAAKMHYVSCGKHRVPIVVRLVVGRGWGQGPSHGQCLASLFAGVPGLRVVLPSNAADARTLLLAAIADDGPVIMLEHRWIHATRGEVGGPVPPLDTIGPRRIHAGDRVTVVASSYMTLEAQQAVQALAAVGCACDLFDLRVARPLRLVEVTASVRRTGRLVVVEDGHRAFGLGAEIVSEVCEHAFASLRCAPIRIGLPDHPTPSSRSLAAAYYPRSPGIARTIGELADVDGAVLDRLCHRLEEQRDGVPLDVPHPDFRGPF